MPKRKFTNKLEKICCEICGETNKAVLHNHHIIQQCELETNNHNTNLICLCANHHYALHHKQITILGLFDSTKLPYKRTVIYRDEITKTCNFPGLENEKSYYGLVNESMKIHEESKNNE